jgi:acetylornithine deacetylase/succinyl-diaminopimelate desuccinylase-like protein
VTRANDGAIDSGASPLRPDVLAAVTKAVHARFPGLPIVPVMSAGATDGMFFRAVGIPTYGISGLFMKSSDDFSHGLNERSPVDALDGDRRTGRASCGTWQSRAQRHLSTVGPRASLSGPSQGS